MKKSSTRNLALAGLFIALGLLLPLLTAQHPALGSRFLPMHLPVLICGFVCGWKYGLAVGLLLPIFRSMLFGMPPMFPVAAAMSVELAVYGCVSGLAHWLLSKKIVNVYVALISAMLCGRIAWGAACLFLYGISGTPFTWGIFVAGAFFNAIPGILIQLIAVPLIVVSLERSGFIQHA